MRNVGLHRTCDRLVVERELVSTKVFMETAQRAGWVDYLDAKAFDGLVSAILEADERAKRPNFIVFLHCPPEVSRRRMVARSSRATDVPPLSYLEFGAIVRFIFLISSNPTNIESWTCLIGGGSNDAFTLLNRRLPYPFPLLS